MWDNRRAFWPMYVGLGLNCVALVRARSGWRRFYRSARSAGRRTSSATSRAWSICCLAPACLLFGGWLAERWAKQGACRRRNCASCSWLGCCTSLSRSASASCRNPYVALALLSLSTCVIAHRRRPAERGLPVHRAESKCAPRSPRRSCSCSRHRQAARPILVGWLTDYVFAGSKASCATRWH